MPDQEIRAGIYQLAETVSIRALHPRSDTKTGLAAPIDERKRGRCDEAALT